ncbi:WD repeat-containing protein 91 [Tanacetum coccineum]
MVDTVMGRKVLLLEIADNSSHELNFKVNVTYRILLWLVNLGLEDNDELQQEEDFPEVKVDFQVLYSNCQTTFITFLGDNIASASVDGTVRIWTYDSSTSASRNATIYCGAEIIVLDIKCSPVEPVFVSAAASKGHGTTYVDKLGFASLTVWNMRTWKPMTVLPLGNDPPAITSLCFNHIRRAESRAWQHDSVSVHVLLLWPEETSSLAWGRILLDRETATKSSAQS